MLVFSRFYGLGALIWAMTACGMEEARPPTAERDPSRNAAQVSCSSTVACGPGQYCSKPDGACAATGACLPIPPACTFPPRLTEVPVCGCDHQSYLSRCLASASENQQGQPKIPTSVGGIGPCGALTCAVSSDCPIDPFGRPQFCRKEKCADAAGYCMEMPWDCAPEGPPALGCDDKVYPNGCVAIISDMNIQRELDGQRSCTTNVECALNEYCKKSDGACGELGLCTAIPARCTFPPRLTEVPVCGCDQQSYLSRCLVSASKNQQGQPKIPTSVGTIGPCGALPCAVSTDCPIDPFGRPQFCRKEKCADAAGYCMEMPWDCGPEGPKALGCNQKVYVNGCVAIISGVNIDHEIFNIFLPTIWK